ncbi:hypothetical protein VARIO8X_130193 [Burkholderiales bacterium 8X]|nr:hypothetical protein VARIO8X_130193 [Burkholderiales bacterium 8X]
MARLAFQGRRAGGGADAGRLHGQLDQGFGRSAARRSLLSGAREARRRRSADVQQLAFGRQRKHALDVPDGDRRGQPVDRVVERVLRARPADSRSPGGGRQARRQGAHHHARSDHRCQDRPRRIARILGPAPGGRHRNGRIPADHVPLQAPDRGRPPGIGRVDQLRQPVVPAQRRGQSQHLRRSLRGGAGQGVRGRPAQEPADHLRAVERAAAQGEGVREPGLVAGAAALGFRVPLNCRNV